MSFKPMKARDVDVDKIKFSPAKTNDKGGKMIYMNYENNGIYLQSPSFELAFDSGTFYPDDKPGCGKYQVRISLKGHEDNKNIKDFHDLLCQMDEKIKGYAKENSLSWFKKKNMSMETLEELYTDTIKVSTDPNTGEPNGKYPPAFGCKIAKWDNKVNCRCFDNDKIELNVNDETKDNFKDLETMFTRGTKVQMVLKCKFIWVVSGKFGCTWGVEQIKITPTLGFNEYAFLDDSDEEGAKSGRASPKAEEPNGNFVEDSSDEDS